MTVARAKLVPPDGGRFSLAAAGLDDWRLGEVEPVSGQVSDLLAPLGGGGRDVLIYVHGFKQTFETAALDAAHLSDGIMFHGQTMVFSWPSKAGFFDAANNLEGDAGALLDAARELFAIAGFAGGAGRNSAIVRYTELVHDFLEMAEGFDTPFEDVFAEAMAQKHAFA